jgi:hypothetical protein
VLALFSLTLIIILLILRAVYFRRRLNRVAYFDERSEIE